MFSQQLKSMCQTAIYCRLSKDDGTNKESSSISTQKEILTSYAESNGWVIYDYYIDDGYTGLNFNRPEFQRMIKDIENGRINCVITKDLSRLGRNYLDCGVYLEIFFPENNVRYIAVNDNVDTINNNSVDFTPFKNILNEMYSKDISKKIKSAKRARFKQGKFIGTTAPFGYIKDPSDKNQLIIDNNTIETVILIFELAKQGLGIARIRNILNEKMILRPGADAIKKGGNFTRYFEENEENKYTWSNNSVRSILRNPVYAGHLVGYKRPVLSMKSNKRLTALPEDWEIVKNTHEPIISQSDFDLVQKMITSRRREMGSKGYDNIFSGIIKCADCGYALRAMSANRRKRPDVIDCVQYCCNNYATNGVKACSMHGIEARALHNVVLEDINNHAKNALDNDRTVIEILLQRIISNEKSELNLMNSERAKLKKRLSELSELFSALYEDKVFNRIDERNYDIMSSKYILEQTHLESRMNVLNEKIESEKKIKLGAEEFVYTIKEYAGIKELTASIINRLIDKITVSEVEEIEGEYIQKVKIYYKFVGCIS